MSADLATEIRLGLEALAIVRSQLSPLIAKLPGYQAGDIETAAACAMQHSFYTEIEKALKLILKIGTNNPFLGGVAQRSAAPNGRTNG